MSESLFINSSVVKYLSLGTSIDPWTQMAKSLVINPLSTVSIITYSRVVLKLANYSLLSNLALYANPLVQAKIEAIGLVDVSLPA